MSQRKKSSQWLRKHCQDPYVKLSQQQGYRSRAVYKLQQILAKNNFLHSKMLVVELGAAPGSWSQYLAQLIKPPGKIIAIDLLPIKPIEHVHLIQGNFLEQATLTELKTHLNGKLADIILSDMAPNLTGITDVDQYAMLELAEFVVQTLPTLLKPQGNLLLKVFQGKQFQFIQSTLVSLFKRITIKKPEASRAKSAEVYLLAHSYRLPNLNCDHNLLS